MNPDMVAIDIDGRLFRFGGIESKSDPPLQICLKILGGPAMLQKKKFQARPLAMLAQRLGIAE